jgi:glycosyltransferase involved in cell wall biosynthesis
MQRSADLLTLSQGEGHAETIQGKLLEYLATGKPVLAMNSPRGVGAAILKRAGVGRCYAHGDVAGAEALLEVCLREGVPKVQPDWAYIGQFDRAALAGRLVDVLDEVAVARIASAAVAEAPA